jgi:hypothetical protein
MTKAKAEQLVDNYLMEMSNRSFDDIAALIWLDTIHKTPEYAEMVKIKMDSDKGTLSN